LDIDIRGILVKKQGNKFYTLMPFRNYIKEDGTKGAYPILSFTNRDRYKLLISKIQTEVARYMANKDISCQN